MPAQAVAGNTCALDTIAAADGLPMHLAHVQFYGYGDEGTRGFSSGAAALAGAINANPNITVDVGQVLDKRFGPDEDPFAKFDDRTLKIGDSDIWPLKGMPGYYMSWGGDAESSAKAGAALGATVPIFFGLMVLIVLMLFNSIRKTLVIWLTVPLSIIGVTVGLLMFNQPFGFMALLGLMSLSGMLIKNAVVLLDEVNAQLDAGKAAFHAIVDSGVSRLIPVSMAASTTILGLIPLLGDAFFVAMAVTIMFGLGFATVLTLIVVPVLYAVFFKVPYEQAA